MTAFRIRARLFRAIVDRIAPMGWEDAAGFHLGTPIPRNLRNIHGDRGTSL